MRIARCELPSKPRVYTGGSGQMGEEKQKIIWKAGEEVTKWILRVDTYSAACGWDKAKTAGKAAIGLPDDKLDFLLTVPEEVRKDWSKLKKAFLDEYRADAASCEQAFLARKRQEGESFLVYYSVLERLYRDAFGVEEATALSDESNLAITRQFLRGIPAQISSKLQMDYPDAKPKDLAKQARRIEDVFAQTQARLEQVRAVESPLITSTQFETLREELNDVKSLLKGQGHAAADRFAREEVNALNQPKANPLRSRKCFGCGSPSHLLRDCDRAPPARGRGISSFRGSNRGRRGARQGPLMTCYNCKGLGHRAAECSSPPLN